MSSSLIKKIKPIIQGQESETAVKTLFTQQTTEGGEDAKNILKEKSKGTMSELESETGVNIL